MGNSFVCPRCGDNFKLHFSNPVVFGYSEDNTLTEQDIIDKLKCDQIIIHCECGERLWMDHIEQGFVPYYKNDLEHLKNARIAYEVAKKTLREAQIAVKRYNNDWVIDPKTLDYSSRYDDEL